MIRRHAIATCDAPDCRVNQTVLVDIRTAEAEIRELGWFIEPMPSSRTFCPHHTPATEDTHHHDRHR